MQIIGPKILKVAALALVTVPFSPEFRWAGEGGWSLGVAYAHAESGPGRDGDDDRRGRGRGRGGNDDRDDNAASDDDVRDQDVPEDRNDTGSRDDNDNHDDRDTRANRNDTRRDSRGLGPEFNITLQYSNGWREWINAGRYVLVDPQGYTVANRQATPDDATRMRELAGQ